MSEQIAPFYDALLLAVSQYLDFTVQNWCSKAVKLDHADFGI